MRKLLARAPWLSAAAVLAAGLLLTFLGLRELAAGRLREQRLQDRRQVGRVFVAVQAALDRQEDLLLAARSRFAGSEDIEPGQWHAFVAGLDLSNRQPGIKSLALVVPVPRPGLVAYLAAQNKHGRPMEVHDRYQPWPGDPAQGPQRGDLFLIEELEPRDTNKGGLGLDLGTNPVQRAAAEAARDQGKPQMTGPISFGDLGLKEPAAGFFMPIYAGGAAPSTVEGRRAALRAWVSLGLRIHPLFEGVLQREGATLGLQVVDWGMDGAGPPRPIFGQGALGVEGETREIRVGGRVWELIFEYPAPAGLGRAETALWGMLGLSLSLALAALIWSLGKRRDRAESIAEERLEGLVQALGRHRAFLEQTPQGVIEFDPEFRIIGWNPGATAIFGHTETDALGRPGTFLVAPEQIPEVRQRWMEPMSQGRSLQGIERHRAKDGREIQCDWRVTPIREGGAGRILGFTGIVEDATGRIQQEEARQQAQRLESLGVLAGGLAHDFNNLLMAIQGHAELAEESLPQGHPAKETLERVQRAVERAAALAHQMLAYAGKARVERRAVDLNRLLEELGDLMRVTVPKGATLNLDFQQGLPSVMADPVQIQQVAMNLLVNAGEALPEGRGHLALRTRVLRVDAAGLARDFAGQALTPGRFVALEMSDDGVGMDAETQARIFEPFFTTKFKGRGLGLSAILGIVRASGGGLRVRSAPGEGTTFIILFPASEVAAPEAAAAPRVDWTRGGRALVVEDEESVRQVLVDSLRASGFEVDEASDGLRGLAAIQGRQDYRVVLMDLTMPGMGGDELLPHLRSRCPRAKVVLMSGYTDTRATEADAFLAKPFKLGDLKAVLAKVLA